MRNMRLGLTLLLTVLLSSFSNAQAYLITAEGDSISGKISILENSKGNEYIRLKGDNGKQTFEILEVKKMVDKRGNKIVPILVEGKYRFGQVVVEGYVTKYLYTPEDESQKFNGEVLIKLDGSVLIVPGAFGFRGLMSEYMKECPNVAQDITNKNYKVYEVDKIVADFNQCIIDSNYRKRTTAADTAEKLASSNLNEETSKKIAEFKTALNNSTLVNNKDEVLEMFDDIVEKLSEGETIPNYLKNAFKRSIASDNTLTALYSEITSQK